MKKNEIISSFISLTFLSVILFLFWENILNFLSAGLMFLIALLIFFIIAGGVLHLVSIVSEPGSQKDQTTYKRFFKALIIFSIPLSIGLYYEWSENIIPSKFSYIAFFVWGNTAIVSLSLLVSKLFEKKSKK